MKSLDFAIKMELDGSEYYLRQAELNKDNHLNKIFTMLAKDEKNHAVILQNKFDKLTYELVDTSKLSNLSNLFKDIGDVRVEVKKLPSQLDLYKAVMEKEHESINLYTKLQTEAVDENEFKLFAFLIMQEVKHFTIFEELVTLLTQPEEWVEDAEFGVRKEY